MTNRKILQDIEDEMYLAMLDNEYESSNLLDNGAVYYENGNDGTDFDWIVNHRTCEFRNYFNIGDKPVVFCTAYLTDEGKLEIFIFADVNQTHYDTITYPDYCTPAEAEEFYEMLLANESKLADRDIYNFDINDIDFDIDVAKYIQYV